MIDILASDAHHEIYLAKFAILQERLGLLQ